MHKELLDKQNSKQLKRELFLISPEADNYNYMNIRYKQLMQRLIKDMVKAEKQEKQRSAFFANMVHELRTPMNAIKGFAELLKAHDVSEEEKLHYAEIINQRSEDLLSLISNLLEVSRIDAGKLSIIEKPGNLRDLFNELYELFYASVEQCRQGRVNLESYIDLAPEQVMLKADFMRLRQVLINLIGNAVKFTERGYVRYGCQALDDNMLLFYVEDTGIGIKEKEQRVIFDRFRQVGGDANVTNENGSGLGLPIVKSIVSLMKGKVWVRSVPGKGSTFYFTLPLKGVRSSV